MKKTANSQSWELTPRNTSDGLPSAGNGWRGTEAAPRPPRPSVALPVALVAGIWGLAVAVPLQWVWAVPAGMLAVAALAWWRLAPADDPFGEIDLVRGDRLFHRGSGREAHVVRAGQLARQTGMVEVKWSDSWVCERYPAHDFTLFTPATPSVPCTSGDLVRTG